MRAALVTPLPPENLFLLAKLMETFRSVSVQPDRSEYQMAAFAAPLHSTELLYKTQNGKMVGLDGSYSRDDVSQC